MGFLNPFNEVIESSTYPFARTSRTSFGQKMLDTFWVFSGSFFSKKRNHIGLFDYGTLMIPYAISKLTFSLLDTNVENKLTLIPAIPLGIMTLVLGAIRYSVAAVLTIIMTPIVTIAHKISSFFSSKLKQAVSGIKITELPNHKESSKRKESDIGSYFSANNSLDFDDFRAEVSLKSTINNVIIEFRRAATGPSSSIVCECCMNGGEDHVPFSISLDLSTDDGISKFIHLLKLNVGDLISGWGDFQEKSDSAIKYHSPDQQQSFYKLKAIARIIPRIEQLRKSRFCLASNSGKLKAELLIELINKIKDSSIDGADGKQSDHKVSSIEEWKQEAQIQKTSSPGNKKQARTITNGEFVGLHRNYFLANIEERLGCKAKTEKAMEKVEKILSSTLRSSR